ncbi:MAG: UDP-4-amino-4,6-dideoxy-N-acetyl-beta-L-altrosamine N-acetyltransferase [Oceanisphaera sp.]|uniref:UDP-4-amino-4, 6-dideoxy-N-acetyl-beta-L-altrosamine N-acetyltransferase n=1 Tax=Oceanisphaera sp. TaxID=1929979 RepID=UPI003C75885B
MTIIPQPQVRAMRYSDLERVLAWRNHADIRRYMYTQHEITLAEHKIWFSRVSNNTDYHLLIFEINNMPSGFINIHQVSGGGIADWGFYLAPETPKGTGENLGDAALRYAFTIANFHKICGQALSYNEPSIRLHRRLSFREEGLLQEQYFDGQHYHDVMCFGLLASEWHAQN